MKRQQVVGWQLLLYWNLRILLSSQFPPVPGIDVCLLKICFPLQHFQAFSSHWCSQPLPSHPRLHLTRSLYGLNAYLHLSSHPKTEGKFETHFFPLGGSPPHCVLLNHPCKKLFIFVPEKSSFPDQKICGFGLVPSKQTWKQTDSILPICSVNLLPHPFQSMQVKHCSTLSINSEFLEQSLKISHKDLFIFFFFSS